MTDVTSEKLYTKLERINEVKRNLKSVMISIGGYEYFQNDPKFEEYPNILNSMQESISSTNRILDVSIYGKDPGEVLSTPETTQKIITPYLSELQYSRSLLIDNLNTKGVQADTNEPLRDLVGKVLDIQGGGGEEPPFKRIIASYHFGPNNMIRIDFIYSHIVYPEIDYSYDTYNIDCLITNESDEDIVFGDNYIYSPILETINGNYSVSTSINDGILYAHNSGMWGGRFSYTTGEDQNQAMKNFVEIVESGSPDVVFLERAADYPHRTVTLNIKENMDAIVNLYRFNDYYYYFTLSFNLIGTDWDVTPDYTITFIMYDSNGENPYTLVVIPENTSVWNGTYSNYELFPYTETEINTLSTYLTNDIILERQQPQEVIDIDYFGADDDIEVITYYEPDRDPYVFRLELHNISPNTITLDDAKYKFSYYSQDIAPTYGIGIEAYYYLVNDLALAPGDVHSVNMTIQHYTGDIQDIEDFANVIRSNQVNLDVQKCYPQDYRTESIEIEPGLGCNFNMYKFNYGSLDSYYCEYILEPTFSGSVIATRSGNFKITDPNTGTEVSLYGYFYKETLYNSGYTLRSILDGVSISNYKTDPITIEYSPMEQYGWYTVGYFGNNNELKAEVQYTEHPQDTSIVPICITNTSDETITLDDAKYLLALYDSYNYAEVTLGDFDTPLTLYGEDEVNLNIKFTQTISDRTYGNFMESILNNQIQLYTDKCYSQAKRTELLDVEDTCKLSIKLFEFNKYRDDSINKVYLVEQKQVNTTGEDIELLNTGNFYMAGSTGEGTQVILTTFGDGLGVWYDDSISSRFIVPSSTEELESLTDYMTNPINRYYNPLPDRNTFYDLGDFGPDDKLVMEIEYNPNLSSDVSILRGFIWKNGNIGDPDFVVNDDKCYLSFYDSFTDTLACASLGSLDPTTNTPTYTIRNQTGPIFFIRLNHTLSNLEYKKFLTRIIDGRIPYMFQKCPLNEQRYELLEIESGVHAATRIYKFYANAETELRPFYFTESYGKLDSGDSYALTVSGNFDMRRYQGDMSYANLWYFSSGTLIKNNLSANWKLFFDPTEDESLVLEGYMTNPIYKTYD